MAPRAPEQDHASAPRGPLDSAGPSAFIPVRHLLAMAAARTRGLLPGGERARLHRAMRAVLGNAASPQELHRLAAAAAVYRALARADNASPDVVSLAALALTIPANSTVLVPATPFRPLVEKALADPTLQIVYTRAPRHDPAAFGRALATLTPGRTITGIFPWRTGPVACAWRTREFPGGTDEGEIARFADGCLAENPAQYGWLEETP